MPLEADRADRDGADPEMHWAAGFDPVSADLFIRREALIGARTQHVFTQLATARAWSSWMPGVQHCDAPEVVRRGQMFRLDYYGRRMDVSIGEWEPPSRFGWAGVTTDLSVYHAWLLRPVSRGVTQALVEVAARGPGAAGVARSRETMLRASYQELVRRLKARAEGDAR